MKKSSWLSKYSRYIVLIIGSIIFMFPLYWLIITSFKTDSTMFQMPPSLFPNPWEFSHYSKMFRYFPFIKFLLNTLVLVGINLAGVLLTAPLVAYSMSRIKWPGRDLCFFILLATIMLPSQVTLIPLYVTFTKLKMIDTYVPLTIGSWFGGGAFNVFLIRQFFLTIPPDLEESAKIDGAGVFLIYRKIMLPLITPVLATVSIFVFMNTWNDFMGPLIYLNNQEIIPLSIALQLFNQQLNGTDYGMLFAASVLMVVPVIVFFFLGQRKFIEGIVLTGMKA